MPKIGPYSPSYYYDGFEAGIDENGPWYAVQYYIDWNDWQGFTNYLMGLVSVSGGAGGLLTITRPHQYEGSPNTWAHDARLVRAVGKAREGPRGEVIYDQAIVGVNYRVPKYDVQGTNGLASIDNSPLPYFRQTFRTSDEEIPLSANTLKLQSGGVGRVIDQPFHLQYPCAELVYTRMLLPYVPSAAVYGLLNGLNNDTWNGFDKGFVRFASINSTYDIQTDGSFASTVEYVFQVKNYDWNSIWIDDGTTANFHLIETVSTPATTPYSYIDFSPIFAE